MSAEVLKSKIAKSLNEIDEVHLKHAYGLLKQLVQQQKFSNINLDKKAINYKIDKGIEQLNNGEGTDFGIFLNEMRKKYAKKK